MQHQFQCHEHNKKTIGSAIFSSPEALLWGCSLQSSARFIILEALLIIWCEKKRSSFVACGCLRSASNFSHSRRNLRWQKNWYFQQFKDINKTFALQPGSEVLSAMNFPNKSALSGKFARVTVRKGHKTKMSRRWIGAPLPDRLWLSMLIIVSRFIATIKKSCIIKCLAIKLKWLSRDT